MSRRYSDFVREILEGEGPARLRAARDLSQEALRRLGHIRPRGTLVKAADRTDALSREDVDALLDELPRAFARGDTELAHELISCLRYAAGGEVSETLRGLLEGRLSSSSDADSAMLLLDALAAIGGTAAVDGITLVLNQGSEELKASATVACRSLATGGQGDDTDEGSSRGSYPARKK